jgi:hypothetical protein
MCQNVVQFYDSFADSPFWTQRNRDAKLRSVNMADCFSSAVSFRIERSVSLSLSLSLQSVTLLRRFLLTVEIYG